MNRLSEDFDFEAVMQGYTPTPTQDCVNPIDCSACGRTVYTDSVSYESYLRTLEHDPANQFICDDCDQASIESHAH
jgi:hypothetical protein